MSGASSAAPLPGVLFDIMKLKANRRSSLWLFFSVSDILRPSAVSELREEASLAAGKKTYTLW
jgi:hypothetical protein